MKQEKFDPKRRKLEEKAHKALDKFMQKHKKAFKVLAKY